MKNVAAKKADALLSTPFSFRPRNASTLTKLSCGERLCMMSQPCIPCLLTWLEKPEGGGTGRDLPLRAPSIPFLGWDPEGPNINTTKSALLPLLDCFSAIAIVIYVVLGPLRHLRTLFLEGPQGLVPSTSRIISPALLTDAK